MKSQASGLEELRARIDDIDQRILELLAQRVETVMRVGDYKRARGMAVYDPERERSMLDRLGHAAPLPLDHETVRHIFERVIDECRRIEQHHIRRT